MKDTNKAETGPALVQAIGLKLRQGFGPELGSWSTRGASLACIGSATSLLDALVDARRIDSGSLLVRGQTAARLLASGEAAYVPRALPLPANTRVDQALRLSARLIGLGAPEVEAVLARCLLLVIRTKRLGELSRLQMRLVCLAHGLCGSPSLLLLEDLVGDLDDAESEPLSEILDGELPGRARIFAANLNSAASRRLIMSSDEVLVGDGDKWQAPKSPSALITAAFWVKCTSDASDFAARLRVGGAEVTESPSSHVLLVARKSGLEIYREAVLSGVTIAQLLPHPGEGFAESRARSVP